MCGEQEAAEYQTKLLWDKKIGTPSMMWAGLPPCHCSHGLVGDPPDAVTIHEAVAS